MMNGIIPRAALSVVSWVLVERMPPGRKFTMAKEVVQHCLTMFNARLETNHTYGIAVTVGGIYTTVSHNEDVGVDCY